MTVLNWDHIAHFRPGEFDAPHEMRPKLIRRLDLAREYAETPFVITSDWREDPTPEDDDDDSSHEFGWAVDIRAHDSGTRYAIVYGAVKAGFNRIGVYDKHVHLDADPTRPGEVLWTGVSR